MTHLVLEEHNNLATTTRSSAVAVIADRTAHRE